jgi:catabolite regulation protein CreA
MEKLAVFKVMEDERLELCGFFDTKEDALAYLTHVKTEIQTKMQHALSGEYICIPTLYFNINRDVK